MGYRLLKWVGDPPLLRPNGWSPAHWKYENARTIALRRFTSRTITPYDVVRLPDGSRQQRPNGLTREYHWPEDHPTFVLEVLEADAKIILLRQPDEFKDVTAIPERLWETVTNDPIIKRPGETSTSGQLVVPQRPVRQIVLPPPPIVSFGRRR